MTYELDLDRIKVNHHAKYLDQILFSSEVNDWKYKHIHAHTMADCCTKTTNFVSNNYNVLNNIPHMLGMHYNTK